MRTKDRIRGVNDQLRREAVKVAGLAPSAELVRTLAKDDDVRAAAREVLARAEKVRGDLNADGRLGRLARDPKLQSEVAALIRSTAGALDATVGAGKRRARRRVFRLVLLVSVVAGAGVWLSRQRGRWTQVDGSAFAEQGSAATRPVQPVGSTGVGVTGTNGAMAPTAERDGQSKPTPAESAAKIESSDPQ